MNRLADDEAIRREQLRQQLADMARQQSLIDSFVKIKQETVSAGAAFEDVADAATVTVQGFHEREDGAIHRDAVLYGVAVFIVREGTYA